MHSASTTRSWEILLDKYECKKGLRVILFNFSKAQYNGAEAVVDCVDPKDARFVYVRLGKSRRQIASFGLIDKRKRVGLECLRIPLDSQDASKIVVQLNRLANSDFNGECGTLQFFTGNGLAYICMASDGSIKRAFTPCCSLVDPTTSQTKQRTNAASSPSCSSTSKYRKVDQQRGRLNSSAFDCLGNFVQGEGASVSYSEEDDSVDNNGRRRPFRKSWRNSFLRRKELFHSGSSLSQNDSGSHRPAGCSETSDPYIEMSPQ
eukprot:GEMP01045922.1.p1 GENE.GEMP01045922.1~~GEMP01045922.1.p1  ORF type:complete len:262 (+),score=28.52 GEMP01045922.1:49-834(+)